MDPGLAGNLSSDATALTACLSCKERKQKCDRVLPHCSRCDRLLLKCCYPSAAWLPSAPQSSNNCCDGATRASTHQDGENGTTLFQGLALAGSKGKACVDLVSNLLREHKWQFDDMVETFFTMYYKWIPIIHQQSFRERYNASPPDTSQEFIALLLSICLLTRPFIEEGEPQSLRGALYTAVKCLFWDPESIAQRSLALIQSGVLLSYYEYAQGRLDTAYITIRTCSSMLEVCQLSSSQHHQLRLPAPGAWSQEDEGLRTRWGVLIHERMISLKNDIPIQPLSITNPGAGLSDDGLLKLHSNTLTSRHVQDPLFASFYLEAQAAVFLDRVLDLIRNTDTMSQGSRLSFQVLDRSLLLFIRYLVQLGLGTCCEAVAITLSAFINLHQWRLNSITSIPSLAQDQLESSDAIDAVIKMISDVALYSAEDAASVKAEDSRICQSPYSVHMVYLIFVYMLKRQAQYSISFHSEIEMLKALLQKQEWRWKIAGEYIANVDHL